MRKRLQCTICAERFIWTEPDFPDECPVCHQYIGISGKPEVAAPFIGFKASKSADNVYRAMERGAEHRMNVASEKLGIPVSELSDMKISNMRDNARVGEDSAPPLSSGAQEIMNFASRQAAQTPQLPEVVTQRAYGPTPEQQILRQTPQDMRRGTPEMMHPKSGIGTGISTLAGLRESRYKMGTWGK